MPKKIPPAREVATTADAPPARLWNMATVAAQTTLSKSQIFYLVSQGSFPKPIRITEGRNAWRAADVDAWIDARIAEAARGDRP